MVMAEEVGSMEVEAQRRRERLKAMRGSQQSTQPPTEPGEDGQMEDQPAEPTLPKPKFRSYIPKTEELKESVIPKPVPLDVESMVKDKLGDATGDALPEDVELTNLAPRKPDWDLKRDVAKSLERLEKRTQRAVAELIRERLEEQKKKGDLVEQVKWGALAQEESAAAPVADEW
ncbi:hypothetical protein RvY_18804 [Ramazzottius varieornatus]|uniref:Coiled-coil domain-containing protein 12 n=1 Tax=Ramazzottius varieornatus TaxID=947166 RepID=A0A1D1W736_RAMVA|nr:hypothetical protein RvY_18804 [Ramazzottius varieornatus]